MTRAAAVLLLLFPSLVQAQHAAPPCVPAVAAAAVGTDSVAVTVTLPTTCKPTSVLLTENDVPVARFSSAPYAATLVTPSGTYTYTATIFNAAGVEIGRASSAPQKIGTPPTTIANGITVGRAKQFDERTLTAMLREVETSLATARFVDPATLAAAIGKLQGVTATSTQIGVSATMLPTAGTERTVTTGGAVTGPTSKTETEVKPDATITKTTTTAASENTTDQTVEKTTQAAFTPTAAALPATASSFTYVPSLGPASQDLLSEQTELTYQAMNLRMLLQRALSDRILLHPRGGVTTIEPRSQPVFGFQVSLDTAPQYRGALAEVLVTITDRVAFAEGAPSLIALLPRDKTYNVATIRKSSAALSLGGVVQLFNVGASAARSRDTLYLVRDADTVALERTPEQRTDKAIAFAWQFRPVLDQRSVTAGSRQVYALVGLPAGHHDDWSGVVEITTRWRRYNKKNKTVGEVIPGSENKQPAYVFNVPPAADYDYATSPQIETIEWVETPNGRVVVTLDGRFPTGTRITAGDVLIDRADNGLLVNTDRRIVFSLPPGMFATTDLALVDPFGLAAPISHTKNIVRNEPLSGLKITAAEASKTGIDTSTVTLTVTAVDPKSATDAFKAPDGRTPRHNPVVVVGTNVFGFANAPLRVEPGNPETKLKFDAPTKALQDAGVVRIIDPLWGPAYVDMRPVSFQSQSKITVADAKLLSASDQTAILAITGTNFADGIEVFVGGTKIPNVTLHSANLLTVPIARDTLRGVKQLVLKLPNKEAALLPVPATDWSRVKIIRQEPLREGESRRVRLEGANLALVTQVQYNGETLGFTLAPHDATIAYLTVTEKVTSSPGEKELTLTTADGATSGYTLVVDPKPSTVVLRTSSE